TGIHRSQWRVIILSSLGGALEFYDFVIYSMFAQYIGAAFFPAADPLNSLLLSFSVFAVGYVARPVGGIVFSHFGDKYGRRRVFIVAMLTMSLATTAIGLLPTYAQWGLGASICMVLLRLLQGFSLGGELPGAITYVAETADPRRVGFAAGFIFFCVNTGVALASGLNLVVHQLLAEPAIAAWGWRIGFLFGGVCGFVSFWLRLSLEETREFQQMKSVASKQPFGELIKSHPANVVAGVAALTATAGFNGLLFAMPALLPRIMGYTPAAASEAQYIGLIVISLGMLVTAWLGDRFPRRYILGAGGLLLLVLAVPFFSAAAERGVNLNLLFVMAGVVASLVNGTMAGVVADLFPTRIRFSGVAVSFNLAFSIFSGIAPLAAVELVKLLGSPTGPAYYMCLCGGITFVGSLFLRRYEGHVGHALQPANAAAQASSVPAP
ncbi:MAG TPA: MFS transporter, partial [Gammaproteobacteria bacterium]|nr:MFS transporter [Gammaproteobacteria bacterium]